MIPAAPTPLRNPRRVRLFCSIGVCSTFYRAAHAVEGLAIRFTEPRTQRRGSLCEPRSEVSGPTQRPVSAHWVVPLTSLRGSQSEPLRYVRGSVTRSPLHCVRRFLAPYLANQPPSTARICPRSSYSRPRLHAADSERARVSAAAMQARARSKRRLLDRDMPVTVAGCDGRGKAAKAEVGVRRTTAASCTRRRPRPAPGTRHAFCYTRQGMGARSLPAQVRQSFRTAIRDAFHTDAPLRNARALRSDHHNWRVTSGRGR